MSTHLPEQWLHWSIDSIKHSDIGIASIIKNVDVCVALIYINIHECNTSNK